MPYPFQVVQLPLSDGKRDDLSATAGEPSALLTADNVIFTSAGCVRPRPGYTSLLTSGVTLFDGATASATATTIGALTYQDAGMATRAAGGTEQPLLVRHGRLLRGSTDGASWEDAGPTWSLTRTDRAVPKVVDYGGATVGGEHLSAGRLVAGVQAQLGGGIAAYGFPRYDLHGSEIRGPITLGTAVPSSQVSVVSCYPSTDVYDAVVYVDSTSHLRIQVTTTGLTAVDTLLASDASLGPIGDGQQSWACWDGGGGFVYVAYATTTANQAKVLKVLVSGVTGAASVAGTVTYNFPDPLLSVAVAVSNTGGRGVIVVSGGDRVRTRVFNTSCVDQAINVDIIQSGANNKAYGVVVGLDAAGTTAYFAWHNIDNGNLEIASRSMTAATGAVYRTLYGRASGGSPDVTVQWRTLFQPVLTKGRLLMGCTKDPGVVNRATWLVLDIGYSAADSYVLPVASGQTEGCRRAGCPAAANLDDDGSVHFGVWEGATFDINGCAVLKAQPIRLTPASPAVAHAGGLTYLGGCATFVYDGKRSYEAGFLEGNPTVNMVAIAGGSLTASASYSVKAVWVHVDGLGNQHRSPASLVATVSTTGVNKQFTITATVPQATSKGPTVYLEIYATAANPSSGAPLYLVNRQLVTAGLAVMSYTLSAEPSITAAQLYTVGNVVDDEKPPGGDRGVAVAGERLWVASGDTVYPSKVLRDGIAPAWSTAGFLGIKVPATLGEVRALAGMDDKLVVIGARATAVITGPGYDDLGNGPGFSPLQVVHPEGNAANARAVAVLPQGVAWLDRYGLVRLLTRGLQASTISGPAVPPAGSWADCDLVYAPARSYTAGEDINDPLLLVGDRGGVVRVMDGESGQWATWTLSASTDPTRWTVVNGEFWCTDAGIGVGVFNVDGGTEDGTDFTMTVRFRPYRLGGQAARGWGRVRRAQVLATPLHDHAFAIRLRADRIDGPELGYKSANVVAGGPVATAWPWSSDLQAVATIQRAAAVVVELTATPAGAQWDQVDLEVQVTPEAAPSRSRA